MAAKSNKKNVKGRHNNNRIHNKKKSRNGNRNAFGVILAVLAIIIISVMAGLLIRRKGNNTVVDSTENSEAVQNVNNREYIEIKPDDCCLYVGTETYLVCKSGNGDVPDNILWSSSDAGIVQIDDKGHIVVNKTGRAIITATSGNLTDSVVIIGIEKEQEAGNMDDEEYFNQELPVYVPDESGNLVVVNPEVTAPVTEQDKNSDNQDKYPTQPDITVPVPEVTVPVHEETMPVHEETMKPDGDNVETVHETAPLPPATEAQAKEDINYKETITASIPELGFTRYSDSPDYVYIYEEDGNYLGEVIVNDSFIQIYIRMRTTRLEQNLKSLIQIIFPDDYQRVYDSFFNASDNTTLSINGHTVRIRPAAGDNHAQLIISY